MARPVTGLIRKVDMSVLSYLSSRAKDALMDSGEKDSIKKSISTLKARLNSYFEGKLKDQFQFGSSTRGTILPRSMNEDSDIDYMIVFNDDESVPQTLLDRLKRFAETYYGKSEIYQSSPTIVLELNHIKFDLVPARVAFWNPFKIPDGNGGWRGTNPNDFNDKLNRMNKEHSNLIKSTIRLVKYWNAVNDNVYDSYLLEQRIVDLAFRGCKNQKEYFFYAIDSLSVENDFVQWRKDAVSRAKDNVAQVKGFERQGMIAKAELELKKLI